MDDFWAKIAQKRALTCIAEELLTLVASITTRGNVEAIFRESRLPAFLGPLLEGEDSQKSVTLLEKRKACFILL